MNRFLIPTLIVLVFLGTLGTLFTRKGTSKEKISPTNRPHIVQRSPLVADFYRRAQSDLTSEGIGFSTQQYVSELSSDKQAEIARAIIDDPDERLSTFGISLLIGLGYEDEAIPKLAKMITASRDLTGVGYAWIHSNDKLLALRMTLKISRHLLDRLDELPAEERKRAELFLCQDGFGTRIHECSKTAIVERLQMMEEILRKEQGRTEGQQ
jgi:hypothetical protein